MQEAVIKKLSLQGDVDLDFKNDTLIAKTLHINNFYGSINQYLHAFHDFNATIRLLDNSIAVDRFDGMIDDSDFHITGRLSNISLWMNEAVMNGDTKLEFNVTSNKLRLEDLFSYDGTNYVPEEYQHEEIVRLKAHGRLLLHFKDNEIQSQDLYVDQFQGKMKIHPLAFENFKGNLHFENDKLQFNQVSGQMGSSDLMLNGYYHLGTNDSYKQLGDKIVINAKKLDLDELIIYEEPQEGEPVDHEAVFNVFELPFRNMVFDLQVNELNYHKYLLKNMHMRGRMTQNHYVYIDDAQLEAAGGNMKLKGYFNGSDPAHIYFSPDLKINNMNIDEVMIKFDNFGQDMMVSENLHGIFTGGIKGKILMHPDLTPRLDESDLKIEVSVVQGKLEKFEPMYALADFFGDKNLSKIIFDKLENNLVMRNGSLFLPNMVINSSLGYIQMSGRQDLDLNMEYYLRIPLKLVTRAAMGKLFGRKADTVDPEQEDEIIYKDPDKRGSYVNVKIVGKPDDYKISLQKNKQIKRKDPGGKEEYFEFEDAEIVVEEK